MKPVKTRELEVGIGANKAEKILQGAMQEFLTHGYAATSMDRVAAAAGVSKTTVYSHFQDKEGLFGALVQKIAQEKFMLFQICSEKPSVALRHLATTHMDQMLQEPESLAFIRLVIGESGRFPELAQTFVRNLTKPGIELLTQYLASCPELKLTDPEATARIFIGSMVYFMMTQELLYGKDIIPMDRDRLIDTLIHLVEPKEL